MPSGQPSRFWRRCRVYFRRFRLAVWMAILLLIAALFYVNQAGLPDFIKGPLLEKLRARGVDLQFSRLHISWSRGIVADNVSFGRADDPNGPQIRFARLVVELNFRALLRRQIEIDSLALRQGRLTWPVADTNRPPRLLVLENVQTDLRFLPNDEWALDNFRATFADARVQLAGTATHASAIRDWSWFQSAPEAASSNPWPVRMRELTDTLQRIYFMAPPDLRLDVHGDARDPWSFSLRLYVNVPGAQTPWGIVDRGRFIARLFPATNNQMSRAELSLTASDAQTPWADITNFNLFIHLASIEGQTNPPAGDLTLKANDAHTRWATATNLELHASFAPLKEHLDTLESNLRLSVQHAHSEWCEATNIHFTAQWVHSLTNPVPLSAYGQLDGEQVQTPWGRARRMTTVGRLRPGAVPRDSSFARAAAKSTTDRATNSSPSVARGPNTASSPPWYGLLEPYALDWTCALAGFESHDITAEGIDGQVNWRMPLLTLTNFHARLGQGQIDVDAKLNVVSGALNASIQSDVDPSRFAPVFPNAMNAWLKQAAWPAPPRLHLQAALLLPDWTNWGPNWLAQIQPSLAVQGHASLPQGAVIKGISLRSAQTHFTLSNQCWELPDLAIALPEGRFEAAFHSDLREKTFHSSVASNIDPRALLPAFPPDARGVFDLLSLSQPPVLHAEIWGNSDHPEQIGARGRLALTNFAFRGEAATGLQTVFQFTNQYLEFFSPHAQFGTQQIMADGLAVDFAQQLIFLTNGLSTADPMVVARAIGPQIGQAIEPYHFFHPPTVHARGTIPMHGEEAADLYFHVEGGPFRWLKFNVADISGDVHWAGLNLTLGDVHTEFYKGRATGSAAVFFNPTIPGTDFKFSITTTATDLHRLMEDVSNRTNRLEGILSGTLVITNANSDDWRQTFGYGKVRLQDGLIWDIPLFGILSKPLDNLAPGVGTSRVNAGACTFIITNGVIRSEDLELRSSVMRLLYRGATDLEGRVNARVEGEPLRDLPLLGPFFSIALSPVIKLFEGKVTGPIDDPKIELLNPIPRLIFMPLHPFRTLKSLFPEDPSASHTNRPATSQPQH